MSKDYQAFFGLSGPAFSRSLPPDGLYDYPQLAEWHYYMRTALAEGAVSVLTGPVGAGKTTAVRSFTATLDATRCQVLYIGHTTCDRTLFRELAHHLGLTPAYLKGDLLAQLHQLIEALWLTKRRKTLLVLDEAHLLPDSLLTELRLFLNFQMDAATPLSLLLVGQPALHQRLREPRHEALAQRTLIRYHLAGLSRDELTSYVHAHMAAVGGDPDLFTPDALDVIDHQAKGIPRAINNLCVYALIHAAWKELRTLDADVIAHVIHDQQGGSHVT